MNEHEDPEGNQPKLDLGQGVSAFVDETQAHGDAANDISPWLAGGANNPDYNTQVEAYSIKIDNTLSQLDNILAAIQANPDGLTPQDQARLRDLFNEVSSRSIKFGRDTKKIQLRYAIREMFLQNILGKLDENEAQRNERRASGDSIPPLVVYVDPIIKCSSDPDYSPEFVADMKKNSALFEDVAKKWWDQRKQTIKNKFTPQEVKRIARPETGYNLFNRADADQVVMAQLLSEVDPENKLTVEILSFCKQFIDDVAKQIADNKFTPTILPEFAPTYRNLVIKFLETYLSPELKPMLEGMEH